MVDTYFPLKVEIPGISSEGICGSPDAPVAWIICFGCRINVWPIPKRLIVNVHLFVPSSHDELVIVVSVQTSRSSSFA